MLYICSFFHNCLPIVIKIIKPLVDSIKLHCEVWRVGSAWASLRVETGREGIWSYHLGILYGGLKEPCPPRWSKGVLSLEIWKFFSYRNGISLILRKTRKPRLPKSYYYFTYKNLQHNMMYFNSKGKVRKFKHALLKGSDLFSTTLF